MRSLVRLGVMLLLVGVAGMLFARGPQEAAVTDARFPNRLDATAAYFDSLPPTTRVADRTVHDYKLQRERELTNVWMRYDHKPMGVHATEYVTMRLAAGDMPELIKSAGGYELEFLHKQDYLFDLTEELIREHMPNYVALHEKYGMSLESIMRNTVYEDKSYMMERTFITNFPDLADTEFGLNHRNRTKHDPYGLMFRDDILQKIFPDARTEADLRELYMRQGDLTLDDVIGDIPIRNMEDLYDYLQQVKELDMRVGERPVIPGQIFGSSESLGSTDWSMRWAMDLVWAWPIVYTEPPDPVFLPRWNDEYRDYALWHNRMYHSGLIEPEIFVMKNDAMNAKAANGEYAVINRWQYGGNRPVIDQLGAERGYGWRFLPAFWKPSQDLLHNVLVGGDFVPWWGGATLTKALKPENVEQFLTWIDWHYSEEYRLLTTWGMPEWYAGEGTSRRYLPEYRHMEDWAVYGKGEIGTQLGLRRDALAGISDSWDYFTPIGTNINIDSPYWTYRLAGALDPHRIEPDDVNMYIIQFEAVTRAYNEQPTIRRFYRDGWSEATFLEDPVYIGFRSVYDAMLPSSAEIFARLFVGPPEDFDRNWEIYEQQFRDAGAPEMLEYFTEIWHDIYRNKVVPNYY